MCVCVCVFCLFCFVFLLEAKKLLDGFLWSFAHLLEVRSDWMYKIFIIEGWKESDISFRKFLPKIDPSMTSFVIKSYLFHNLRHSCSRIYVLSGTYVYWRFCFTIRTVTLSLIRELTLFCFVFCWELKLEVQRQRSFYFIPPALLEVLPTLLRLSVCLSRLNGLYLKNHWSDFLDLLHTYWKLGPIECIKFSESRNEKKVTFLGF